MLTSRGCRAWLVLGGIHIMIMLSIALLMVLYVKWDSWPSKKRITGFFNPATQDTKFSLNQFSKIVLLIYPLGVQLYHVFSGPFWHHVPYKCCPLYTTRGCKYSLEAEPHTSTVYMAFPHVWIRRTSSLIGIENWLNWIIIKNSFSFKTLKYMLKNDANVSSLRHFALGLAPQVFSISLDLVIASWS